MVVTEVTCVVLKYWIDNSVVTCTLANYTAIIGLVGGEMMDRLTPTIHPF